MPSPVIELHSTTAQKTITELCKLVAAYGLPEQMVSDNGPQFVSEEFATFVKLNWIKHIHCAPYHLPSNGVAERFEQTFKKEMKANCDSPLSCSHRLSNFLFCLDILLMLTIMNRFANCWWGEWSLPDCICFILTLVGKSMISKLPKKLTMTKQ